MARPRHSHIPDELKAIARWLLYKLGKRGGKVTKIPKQALSPRRNASSTDPSTWATFDEAVAACAANDFIDGLGLVLSDEDDICGIDIDHCRNPDTGELTPEAEHAVRLLNSYTEVSQSGTGLHILLHGRPPGTKNRHEPFEVYSTGRYFAMTGDHVEGTPTTIEHRQDELDKWYTGVFGQAEGVEPSQPVVDPAPTADDEDVLASLRRRGKSKHKFIALFDKGDWRKAGDYESQSEADLALCTMLAVKCGGSAAQVDRLFRRSALMRSKWNEKRGEATYGEMTVAQALENVNKKSAKVPSQRDRLFEIASAAELFHTPRGDAFASVARDGHTEILRVEGTEFRSWLLYEYFGRVGTAPGKNAMSETLPTVCAKARIEGDEREVHARVAPHEGKVYIDMGDETFRVIEVDATGWRVLPASPIPFFRTANTKALPDPVAGGSIEELRSFVNVATHDDFVLLVAWLVGALHPAGPYPLLILQGEQGSAKSTTSRIIRNLVDPGVPSHRAMPRSEWDLMIAAQYTRVLAFDNLSGLTAPMSDAFCQLATGAGFGARKLYTDDDEKVFSAKRPIMANGISDLAKREDLASRSIVLRLPHIAASARRRERDLDAEFDKAMPTIFGALLDGVSAALRNVDSIKLDSHPRMADFAVWVVAAETAWGWEPGTFMAAYETNRSEVIHSALEGDAVAAGVLALVYPTGEFTGTMTELLHELNETVAQPYRVGKWWPDTPRALSDRLTRLGDFFHSVGVSVARDREKSGPRRNLVVVTHDHAAARVHIDPCMLEPDYFVPAKTDRRDDPEQGAFIN